ncbi:helix-hairpin-helix domain-containing protein [Vibrio metschnikovii]|uniref:Helix-hairpin-helix domain-containing protein n=1 Tax=bacterium 19MO03SA05 TaxID=2920620 RepID=A0AAU6VDR3_UNCXX|nr:MULTISPECIES: helix-hairpin-helix domain-containing protein [Vibrio]EKO3572920.1 helix-hairpin-helix domain-containing protein [Vibrio metschnikovii]EKO3579267.1 helix-hairpin-helix domain-containing protein [Vibrio metschnikovii]EKO3592653.1 helix-hairpin-helix domain-containing protein [Vibrio metschnikovii]EKO3600831.1 helix-hairpin-helix domain-containing protein [Vibrio metschnikovii]EKO3654828.1 helix-hairpin-helix domain-containing protein [Vibrio metschnikovii]
MIKNYLLALLLGLSLPVSQAMGEETVSVNQGFEITVNVNTASAEEIATLLQGIGLQKAQAIVEYREINGQFLTKEDLTKVKGIGPAIVARNDKRILL